jgi:hypothetical protein
LPPKSGISSQFGERLWAPFGRGQGNLRVQLRRRHLRGDSAGFAAASPHNEVHCGTVPAITTRRCGRSSLSQIVKSRRASLVELWCPALALNLQPSPKTLTFQLTLAVAKVIIFLRRCLCVARPMHNRRKSLILPVPIDEIPLVRVSHRGDQRHATHAKQCIHSELTTALQEKFDLLMREDGMLAKLILKLRDIPCSSAVFGGWVRDHVANLLTDRKARAPRDIDIVVSGIGSGELRSRLGSTAIPTLFGGFTIETDSTSLDIWPLGETFLIVRHRLPVAFELLPIVADFNINAIVFKPAQIWIKPSLLDDGCIAGLRASLIDFQYDWIPFPTLQAARIVIYCAKLGLSMSDDVKTFLSNELVDQGKFASVIEGVLTFCPEDCIPNALSLAERFGPFQTG